MPRRERGPAPLVDPPPRWPSALVGVVAFGLYAWQAPSVVGDKDSAELTLALAFNGVAHPTGYPLYVVLGHLFGSVLVALGASWAVAANLWSALGGAVAVGFLHALSTRLLTAPRAALLALLPTALFATNPMWTIEASLAEVNSWHVAWALATVFVFRALLTELRAALSWSAQRGLRLAAGWGLLCGLGGAHHSTALLVAAPLSVALVLAGRAKGRVGPREVLAVLGGALVPLASLGFIAWRAFHPAAWQWPTLEPSWASVWDHLTGADYGWFLGRFAPSVEQQGFLTRYVYPPLWPAVVAFTFWGFRSARRWLLAPLAVTMLLTLGFAFSYGVPDPSSYFCVPLTLSAAGACAVVSELPWLRRAAVPLAAGAAILVAAVSVSWSLAGRDRRLVLEAFDARVRSMWSSVPDAPAFLLWPSDMSARIVILQRLEGQKLQVELVNPLQLPAAPVRRAFVARHGFDPVEGLSLPSAANPTLPEVWGYSEAIGRRINQLGSLPVVMFDPERESVRLLRRP